MPDPIAGRCPTVESAGCWRYIAYNDGGTTTPVTPEVQGDKLQLNPATPHTVTDFFSYGAWYNTPVDITGKAVEASYTAYLDGGDAAAHNEGLTFAMIEGTTIAGGPNIPAPVPFDPTPRDATHLLGTDYGAGDGGLGFSGYKGDTGNEDGHKNLAVALLTASAERDASPGTDIGYNASRIGLLQGRKWGASPTDPDVYVRTGRWYDVKDVAPSIYGGATANSRPVHVAAQLNPTATAGTWHATVFVDGAKTLDSDVALPNVVYMGFTSATGEFPQRHAISNASIKVGAPVAAVIAATPNPVDLGQVNVGNTSTPTAVTLTNTGTVDAQLSNVTVSGPFAVSGVPASLAPSQSAVVSATFTPTAAGPATGKASITVNSTTGAGTASFALTGTGVPVGVAIGAPYHKVTPDRILDTRVSGGPIGPNSVRSVKVTGAKGVPEDAGAVVMNVTATEPTEPGYVTVYPTGSPVPTASNLNFVPGQNIANLVTAKVGTGGKVDIYNFAGNTHVLFDIVGWFPGGSVGATTLSTQAGGGEFVPLSPTRILDTRAGVGAPATPIGPDSSIDLQVAGRGNVPENGAAAVVINLTATETTDSSYLTAWPTGDQRTTSTVNFTAGTNTPNLAVVPLGAGGKISVYNFAGNTDALADVVGYYTAEGVAAGGGLFHPMAPIRFVDTRTDPVNHSLATAGTLKVQIRGMNQIPAGAVGVVANVTATNTTQSGYLTAYPTGEPLPNTSSLNFVPGQNVPNLVMAKLGADGSLSIYNFAGPTDVIVDVVGWYGS